MEKVIKILLITVAIGVVACNTERNPVALKKGNYLLKKTDHNITGVRDLVRPDLGSAVLHIGDNDSLTFPGFKNIGMELFGQDRFKYRISGDEITLYNDNFKETFPFGITKDSLLKLEVDSDKFKNVYFEYQQLKLKGKYKIMGFTVVDSNAWKNVRTPRIEAILNAVAFEFHKDKSVLVDLQLLNYLLKKSTPRDTLFTYKIEENEIAFSNSKESFNIPYTYDGTLRLLIDDKNFKKLDLGEVE